MSGRIRVNSKVISFSVPPQVLRRLDEYARRSYLNRSEFLRRMLDIYAVSSISANGRSLEDKLGSQMHNPLGPDIAGILRAFWTARRDPITDGAVYAEALISDEAGNVLIVYDEDKTSTGGCGWRFPGCRISTLDFDEELRSGIEFYTGCAVSIGSMIDARTLSDPEVVGKEYALLSFEAMLLYQPRTDIAQHGLGQFTSSRWVDATEAASQLNSPVSPEVARHLAGLRL